MNTGGTCLIFGCNAWRKSFCESAQCVCHSGTCAVDGVCVQDTMEFGEQESNVAGDVDAKQGKIDEAVLLHFFSGAAVYGMVIAMIIRRVRRSAMTATTPHNYSLLADAVEG